MCIRDRTRQPTPGRRPRPAHSHRPPTPRRDRPRPPLPVPRVHRTPGDQRGPPHPVVESRPRDDLGRHRDPPVRLPPPPDPPTSHHHHLEGHRRVGVHRTRRPTHHPTARRTTGRTTWRARATEPGGQPPENRDDHGSERRRLRARPCPHTD